MNTLVFTDRNALWVWPSASGDKPNQYVEFRQEFALSDKPESASIYISADSNYAVWLID